MADTEKNATPMTTGAEAAERAALAASIRRMVDAGPGSDPAVFDQLALKVFDFQYRRNPAYREFCRARNAAPETIVSWRDIPAFPTEAFKGSIVTSFPLEDAVMAQLTSGTTSANERGKIFRDEIGRELMFAANRQMTGHWLFPDLAEGVRCRILILAPSPKMAPSMGMAIGMEETRAAFGTEDSTFVLGWSGIDMRALVEALRGAEGSGVPVALVGSTSAFVYFFKAAVKKDLRFRLPAGSRLCDGGGYRGRFGRFTRDDYHKMAVEVLGVAESHCVNTLGMAETATNYFDDILRKTWTGEGEGTSARKLTPPWCRVTAAGLDDLSLADPGEIGLLKHYDLCNLPTVIGVQSDNLGVCYEDGSFEVLGRAQVLDGKVSPLPAERAVGPMGDKRVFRLLEAYVDFSIDFKMGRFRAPPSTPEAAKDEIPAPCECATVNDDLVAGTEDAEARERAATALRKEVPAEDGRPIGTP